MAQLTPTDLQKGLDLIRQRAVEDPEVYCFGNEQQRGLVLTLDEHDKDHPVKPFPDRPHLRELIRLFRDEQMVAVGKSRQMMVSWAVMAYVTWELLHPGRRWAVTCKKFDDADALLERGVHILKNIPAPLRPKYERKQGLITVHYENAPSAQVQGLAQDAHAARSKTFSGMVIDEAAFTDNLTELYAASKPTTMNGGKVFLVSSPNGKDPFYNLLSDNGRLAL